MMLERDQGQMRNKMESETREWGKEREEKKQ